MVLRLSRARRRAAKFRLETRRLSSFISMALSGAAGVGGTMTSVNSVVQVAMKIIRVIEAVPAFSGWVHVCAHPFFKLQIDMFQVVF